MESVGEINEPFQEIEHRNTNEEPEMKEELKSDGEDEMILPEVSDVADIDPLQIDSMKKEGSEKLSHNCKTAYELWSEERKLELKAQNPDLSSYKMTSLLDKKWRALPDSVKKIWNNRVKPTRQSSRPQKPRKIKDIPGIERVQKKPAAAQEEPEFKRQYIPLTLYPDSYDDEEKSKFNKIQGAEMEKRKLRRKKAEKPNRRYTAYTIWAKQVGEVLRKERPDISFTEASKRLGRMWRELPALEKYNFRRRAKRLNEKIVKTQPETKQKKNKADTVAQVSSKGRVLAKSKKLENYCLVEEKTKKRNKNKIEA